MPGAGGRPLRVAHLTTVDMSLALLLGTELAYDVQVGFTTYGISAPGPYVDRVEELGIRHVPVASLTRSWDVRADLRAFAELVRVLRRLRPDVLHTHNPKTGVLGRIAGRLAGVPVVVNTCHGLWAGPGDSRRRRALVLGLEALAAQFSHAELYQNAEDRRALRRAVPAWRSRVVGNGVDLTRFRPDAEGRARVRDEWGIGPGEVLVGGVGRRVAEKGIAEFAAAAESLGDRASFVWIGPEDLGKPDAWRGPAGRVRLVGERIDMPAVYNALDIFVLPSYREGFSRSGMEAAACGKALVLTDIRGCREVGRHGREVLLVPPRDPGALTEAVRRLVEDSRLRDSLGQAAHAYAREHFDQRAVAAMSVRTYQAVAGRRGRQVDRSVGKVGKVWVGRVSGAHRPAQRAVDVTVAVAASAVLSPVLAGVAALVRVRLGPPVLFRQTRVGRQGRPFAIVKFRTMRPPGYEGQPDSERETGLGRALRATSLDELPQLWNVLCGQMSLIGPRPTLPEQVAQYTDRQRGRLAVRPGLTGWAQVNGRNSIPWPERIELDLWYVEHRSLALDLRILGLTVWRLVRPRGVYGAGGVNPGFPGADGDLP